MDSEEYDASADYAHIQVLHGLLQDQALGFDVLESMAEPDLGIA